MEVQFTTLGALIGLAIAIVLIVRKIQPAYCLIGGTGTIISVIFFLAAG